MDDVEFPDDGELAEMRLNRRAAWKRARKKGADYSEVKFCPTCGRVICHEMVVGQKVEGTVRCMCRDHRPEFVRLTGGWVNE